MAKKSEKLINLLGGEVKIDDKIRLKLNEKVKENKSSTIGYKEFFEKCFPTEQYKELFEESYPNEKYELQPFVYIIGQSLCRISKDKKEDEPLLSALVAAKNYGVPGRGFFKIGEELGRYKCEDKDNIIKKLEYYLTELKLVYGIKDKK